MGGVMKIIRLPCVGIAVALALAGASCAVAGAVTGVERAYVMAARGSLSNQIHAIEYIHRAPLARDLGGQTAHIMVEFRVQRSGVVTATSLYRSSGSKQFDAHILHWAMAVHFPPFPAAMAQPFQVFGLPLTFTPDR
jgi:TonB family protein